MGPQERHTWPLAKAEIRGYSRGYADAVAAKGPTGPAAGEAWFHINGEIHKGSIQALTLTGDADAVVQWKCSGYSMRDGTDGRAWTDEEIGHVDIPLAPDPPKLAPAPPKLAPDSAKPVTITSLTVEEGGTVYLADMHNVVGAGRKGYSVWGQKDRGLHNTPKRSWGEWWANVSFWAMIGAMASGIIFLAAKSITKAALEAAGYWHSG